MRSLERIVALLPIAMYIRLSVWEVSQNSKPTKRVCLFSFYIHCFSTSFMGHVAWNKPDFIWFDMQPYKLVFGFEKYPGLPDFSVSAKTGLETYLHLIHRDVQTRMWTQNL